MILGMKHHTILILIYMYPILSLIIVLTGSAIIIAHTIKHLMLKYSLTENRRFYGCYSTTRLSKVQLSKTILDTLDVFCMLFKRAALYHCYSAARLSNYQRQYWTY